MTGAEEAVLESPAAEAAPEGGSPEAAAPQDEFHGFDEAQKKRVSEIVQGRLKGWTRFGKPEEVESRLKRAEEIERWANSVRERVGSAPGKPLKDGGKP